MIPRYDAVVLAGGGARRMGGRDKVSLRVGGQRLLDRALEAVANAGATVVVGPRRTTSRPVRWTHEDPPGGGPVPALRAGLAQVAAAHVVVLAADLPFVDAATVASLLAAVGEGGVVLDDTTGRPQWLVSAWPTGVLRRLLPAGGALGAALAAANPAHLRPVAEGPPPWYDCDTPEQLYRAREWA